MSTILLTGFTPFDHETTNPSWEVLRQLDLASAFPGHEIHIAQLPCEFGIAVRNLEALLEKITPEIVVCLGQAGGRAELSVERVAINVDDARIPDNAGMQPIDQAIVADGPVGYFSSLPIKAIVQALREHGIPANVSQTAGTYVCNHVFYGLMHYANTHPQLKRAGFIHIPYLPTQACAHVGAPSMSLETMTHALQLLIDVCIKQSKDVVISAGTLC